MAAGDFTGVTGNPPATGPNASPQPQQPVAMPSPGPMAGGAETPNPSPTTVPPSADSPGMMPAPMDPSPTSGPNAPAEEPTMPGPDFNVCDGAPTRPMATAQLSLVLALTPPPSANSSDPFGALRAGLHDFFADADSTGVSVSLSALRGTDVCAPRLSALAPSMALPVSAALLDLQLLGALPTQGLTTAEPLAAALDSLAATSSPDGVQAAVVMVNGAGEPACADPLADLATVAGAAAGTGTRTFVFDFAAAPEAYKLVASGGGTGAPRSLALDDASALTHALRGVRREVRDCTFALPNMSGGFDANLMALTLEYADGREVAIGRLSQAAACGGQQGFYFDDPTAPTRIQVCPAVCEQLAQGANLRTDIGCPASLVD